MILKTQGRVAVALAVLLLGASCASEGDSGVAEGVTVVVTTTMLGDIARNIVGDDGSVEVLFPIGASPHDFHPSSAQVTAIYGADLVLANGLHLEEGLLDLLATAEADGVNVVEVAELLDPLTFDGRDPCETDHEEVSHNGACDPHVWFDPSRDAETAQVIARLLAVIDSSVPWADRADVYAADLVVADAQIVELLKPIPATDRLLVTNHDSFGYFADRYGFVVVGTVIPGGSTLSEPSSVDLAELVAVINESGVSAIFTETSEPTALADAIADEVDHEVEVISVYTGSLGEQGSGAETLIGMLLTNAQRIASGLS
jgi:zinc/manganese transport system substrate-binding protein